MGYLHISNLYKDQRILWMKRCYALEKVHGTSAHVKWDGKTSTVTFYSGGEKHENFVKLFDEEKLRAGFETLGYPEITIYGEAYGGKQQGMKDTYGPELKFIAFDVQVGENWLAVPDMDQVAKNLGFEVVPWEETSTDLNALDELRDRPSEVAVRRGITEPKPREGVILRPLQEMHTNNGSRLICKHKGAAFEERATPQKVVDVSKLQVLKDAEAIAQEWVTEERLSHVLQHLTVDGAVPQIEQTGKVISEMIQDVYREAAGEIVESKPASAAIGKRTAQLFKQHLQAAFR